MVSFCSGETLNISYLTPYMQSVEPDFRNGVNFAVAGASTEPERKPFNLDVQIGHFLQFRARSLQLLLEGFILFSFILKIFGINNPLPFLIVSFSS